MEKITIYALLKKFELWVKKNEIQFLKKEEDRKEVLELLKGLVSIFSEALNKQKKGDKDLSELLDWFDVHKKGKSLWEKLLSCALNDIDSESKGNSRIFKYLDAATRFEDLLYGLEPYYRDHTLHCLWVYFIGEYLLRDLLSGIQYDLNWYLYNSIEGDSASYSKVLLENARKKEKEICKRVNEKKDAIWCIMALCHDLGYSLAKLEKLNEKVKDVLKFVDLPDFRHIGYSLDIEHQYHVSQFLELMAMEVWIVPSEDNKEVRIQGYRDDSTYWRLCQSFEKKEHGILSAYLIYKNLSIFADAWVRGPAENWGLDDDEAIDNIMRGDILYAIALHEFEFAYLSQLSSLADVLMIADEMEEFSRYGRQLLSRKYNDTTAETSISFRPAGLKRGQDVEVAIIYEVAKHLTDKDYFEFMKRKSERLNKIYSLGLSQGRDKEKYCTIKSLKLTAERNGSKYFIQFLRTSKHKGYLPAADIDSKSYNKGEYILTSDDDKLMVNLKDKKIPLDKWLENAILK
jgi:hypothetical protein